MGGQSHRKSLVFSWNLLFWPAARGIAHEPSWVSVQFPVSPNFFSPSVEQNEELVLYLENVFHLKSTFLSSTGQGEFNVNLGLEHFSEITILPSRS